MCQPSPPSPPSSSSSPCPSSNILNPSATATNTTTSLSLSIDEEDETTMATSSSPNATTTTTARIRRKKRDKDGQYSLTTKAATKTAVINKRVYTMKSRSNQKHGHDKPTGGMDALIPSLIGIMVLIVCVMGKLGFRGRATYAGVDLGTTNSVICIQKDQPNSLSAKSSHHMTLMIECIKDPITDSPIIPSVVSFLETHEQQTSKEKRVPSLLNPHPSMVWVGEQAKRRINSHPHHTLYHAKRVMGKQSLDDPAIQTLINEVEFGVIIKSNDKEDDMNHTNEEDESSANNKNQVYFTVPDTDEYISPMQVGGYVINYLKTIMDRYVGHENIRSVVICVPAKFTLHQRQLTAEAYALAGMKVSRIIEEPTAAALAYGLHKKTNVNYIMVYDFGGGTLDISILYVTSNFVDVLGSDGDDTLGGTDFDIAIANYLLQQPVSLYHHSSHDNTNSDNNDDNDGKMTSAAAELISGQQVVDIVTNVLKKLYDREILQQQQEQQQQQQNQQRHQTKKNMMVDFEEILSTTCPKLDTTPLCTVSSLHMIGELIKIDLSNQYHDYLEQSAKRDIEHNVIHDELTIKMTNERSNDIIATKQQCYGLLHDDDDDHNTKISTIQDFCNELQLISLSTISYDTFVQQIGVELFQRSIIPMERVLRALNLQIHDIDEIVMVGGTTRMPHIRNMVKSYMQTDHLNINIDPDITIAYGAASVID